MLRMDTECLFFADAKYQMYVWTEKNACPDTLRKEATWAFRVLEFLGAPAGFVVNLWRTPNDRNLPPNAFPTRAEVNGGWAYPGRPEVFIFRAEEWDRVLIHECIHALLWDVDIDSSVKPCLEESLGQGTLTDALFEAATELNAEWMWCIIHAPVDDNRGSTWLKQQLWQSEQAHNILARSDNIWSEDTSVFAYYVLKAVLALDMKTFLLDWLASTVDTNKWCVLWKNHKAVFLEKAQTKKGNNSQMLSMRMTNPAISS